MGMDTVFHRTERHIINTMYLIFKILFEESFLSFIE